MVFDNLRILAQGGRVVSLVEKKIGLLREGALIRVAASAGKHGDDHDADDDAPQKPAGAFRPLAANPSIVGR